MFDVIPFFYKSHWEKDNGGLPHKYPFNLYFDDKLKMFRQKSTEELSALLNQIYEQGSLADGSMSSESGQGYSKKVANYICDHSGVTLNSKILEIGFGSGILLKELKERGYNNLFGLEPGSHTRVDGLECVKMVKDFYPSDKITEKMDLIYSFAILEHIEDPLSFINQQINQLTDEGKIIFSVPNCEPYIESGDLSMFIHEHFNYFTTESIVKLIEKTSFLIENLSIIDGAFIVTITKKNNKKAPTFIPVIPQSFEKKVVSHLNSIYAILEKYQQDDVAVYVPIRAMNTLFIVGKTNVRLVDDNSEMHRKYIPAFSSRIESFESLLLNPPKILIIFSRTFGEKIKSKCLEEKELRNTKVLTLSDLDNILV
jgi:SAM-dependent methyltransferase